MRLSLPSVLTLALLVPLGHTQRGERAGGEKESDIQPYDEVVPEDAERHAGLFIAHVADGKLLYEIPSGALDRDLLWVSHIAGTKAGHGYGGTPAGRRVVRWELRNEDVLLREVSYSIRAESDDSIRHAVQATSVAPILASFPVKAWGKDKAPVIDVTGCSWDDLQEFSAKRRPERLGVDKPSGSFFERSRPSRTNIETKVLMTYKLSRASPRQRRPGLRPRRDAGADRARPQPGRR